MAANGLGDSARTVCETDAKAEAERLLADPRFHVSERHRAFLNYIIDAFFEGRAEAVKAYSIAVDVFHRPTSFDPSSDPIVRIEAARLRETLEKYYKDLRGEPGARLDIPRGRYLPVFVQRDSPPCPLEEAEVARTAIATEAPSRPLERPITTGGYWIGGLIVLAAAAVSGFLMYGITGSLSVDTRKPAVILSMNAEPDETALGRTIAQDLAVSLARFGTVRLMSGGTGASYRAEGNQSTYNVSMRLSQEDDAVSIWWQVSDHGTGEAVWTDKETRPSSPDTRADALHDLVFGLSRRLAGSTGVINELELRRDIPSSATGNLCVLRGEFAIEVRDPARLKSARICLESTIGPAPDDVDAMATLARVMLWTGRTTGDDAYFGRGVDLANKAATISPSSPRAALAQMATQYQIGQNEVAMAAGRRGISVNPENADLLAKLGMVSFLSGNWEEGRSLSERAVQVAGRPIRDASFVMILDAYRQGDYAQAVYLARQVPAADTPTAVLKLAAVARMGNRTLTDREIAAARLQHPDFDRTVSAMFSGNRYDPNLEASLRAGIGEAGLLTPAFAANGAM